MSQARKPNVLRFRATTFLSLKDGLPWTGKPARESFVARGESNVWCRGHNRSRAEYCPCSERRWQRGEANSIWLENLCYIIKCREMERACFAPTFSGDAPGPFGEYAGSNQFGQVLADFWGLDAAVFAGA